MQILGFFVWDPERNLLTLPVINHPITWYGLLFALGFIVGYRFVRTLFTQQLMYLGAAKAKEEGVFLADRMTMASILGTIVGARLGHVFFYGWPYYAQHPFAILRIWEGGLASHGAVIGILLAIIIFVLWTQRKAPFIRFLLVLDILMIPAAFAAGCIRIGNFINQEILGTPTTLPWAVVFLHPIEGPAGLPLHPVQLYESFFYFSVCGLLLFLWKRMGKTIGSGMLSGWFFILIFGFRFFIEFLKLPQSQLVDETASLNMGQWLSLPLVLLGIFLVVYQWRRVRSTQA